MIKNFNVTESLMWIAALERVYNNYEIDGTNICPLCAHANSNCYSCIWFLLSGENCVEAAKRVSGTDMVAFHRFPSNTDLHDI